MQKKKKNCATENTFENIEIPMMKIIKWHEFRVMHCGKDSNPRKLLYTQNIDLKFRLVWAETVVESKQSKLLSWTYAGKIPLNRSDLQKRRCLRQQQRHVT